jgi:hypothetical protein
MALDKKIARRWVKALLSGKYKQGKAELRDGSNRFCCLGVLCDISKRGVWADTAYIVGFHDRNSEVLNDEMLEWAGLSDELQNQLAEINDNGSRFATIAKRICKEAGIEMPEVAKK